jgi:phosphoglycerol transferase MdoB-like AlkP superfamily enzyme
MKGRLLFTLKYFVFWVCVFVLAKLAFVLYQHNQSFELGAGVWLGVFLNGLKLDFSTAGYFTLLPSIILVATSFTNSKTVRVIMGIYTGLLLVVFLLITLVDMEVYKYWGARLDSTPLRFLGKPREVLASSSLITIFLYLISLVALVYFLFKLYNKIVASSLVNSGKPGKTGLVIQLLLTCILLLPVRGGTGVSPINTGSVYFSKTAFANHAAVNVVWNFGQSLMEGKETRNPYVFYTKKNYEAGLKALYHSGDSTIPILSSPEPKILLILMETFSAKLIEPLGGAKGVTPRFNELCKKGVLFSNIYSTDSRTDKGLATIISGYPVLEAIPILKYPEKTINMPFLSKSLIDKGYHASFLYGGDVDFANMRSYLINGGFMDILSDSDFPSSMKTGKWGVPDHDFFNRLTEDIRSDSGKWFKVALTLSNHEPFEIPVKPKFGNRNITEKFFSAAYYADSCLGDFIDRFRETEQWENTLVIIVADHGSRLPHFDDIFEPGKHHIPLLFTGGAVTKDTLVEKTGSQADVAFTLLRQLNLPTDKYVLGKDLLSPQTKSFAFYSIKNGIAMLTDTSGFGYDFITGDYSYQYGTTDTLHVEVAKAFQQYMFDHYLNLGPAKRH